MGKARVPIDHPPHNHHTCSTCFLFVFFLAPSFTGVHVQQRVGGCELLENNQPGLLFINDAFNGQSGDQLSINKDQYTFKGHWHWPAMWDTMEFDQLKWLHENVFYPLCLRKLKIHLHNHKNRIMRKGTYTTVEVSTTLFQKSENSFIKLLNHDRKVKIANMFRPRCGLHHGRVNCGTVTGAGNNNRRLRGGRCPVVTHHLFFYQAFGP